MTELTPEAAIAIIASHGADPARWPDEVRASLLALAARDPQLAAALAEARALDADLAGWLAAPVPLAAVDIAAITAQRQESVPVARRAAGWRPALVAASLTMVLATAGWLAMPGTKSPDAAARPPLAVAEAGDADLAFAYVFTPTAAEEDLI